MKRRTFLQAAMATPLLGVACRCESSKPPPKAAGEYILPNRLVQRSWAARQLSFPFAAEYMAEQTWKLREWRRYKNDPSGEWHEMTRDNNVGVVEVNLSVVECTDSPRQHDPRIEREIQQRELHRVTCHTLMLYYHHGTTWWFVPRTRDRIWERHSPTCPAAPSWNCPCQRWIPTSTDEWEIVGFNILHSGWYRMFDRNDSIWMANPNLIISYRWPGCGDLLREHWFRKATAHGRLTNVARGACCEDLLAG